MMNLPDFLIIGAARCGTSSLYASLIQHPVIKGPSGLKGSNDKEAHFFDRKYKTHGLRWYKELFKGFPHCLYFEATPNYLYDPKCPTLIKRHLPDCKFIVMLRNPVDRAWSHFWHWQRKDNFKQSSLFNGDNLYVNKGIYHIQLKRWFQHFNPEQFMIIKSEEYFKDENKFIVAICDWFRIERKAGIKYYDPVRPNAKKKEKYPPIPERLKRYLTGFYKPHNEELYKLIGMTW